MRIQKQSVLKTFLVKRSLAGVWQVWQWPTECTFLRSHDNMFCHLTNAAVTEHGAIKELEIRLTRLPTLPKRFFLLHSRLQ